MIANRINSQVEYIVYNNNIEEVKEFLNDRTSFSINEPEIFETIEEAKEVFNEMLRDDTIHGEPEFETLDPDGEWYYTKEGKVLLSADIYWNRYDKQYYFIEDMTIIVKEQLPFEEPETELYIKNKLVVKGQYIIYDELFHVKVLTEEVFNANYQK